MNPEYKKLWRARDLFNKFVISDFNIFYNYGLEYSYLLVFWQRMRGLRPPTQALRPDTYLKTYLHDTYLWRSSPSWPILKLVYPIFGPKMTHNGSLWPSDRLEHIKMISKWFQVWRGKISCRNMEVFTTKKPTSGFKVMTGSRKWPHAAKRDELYMPPKFRPDRIRCLGGLFAHIKMASKIEFSAIFRFLGWKIFFLKLDSDSLRDPLAALWSFFLNSDPVKTRFFTVRVLHIV